MFYEMHTFTFVKQNVYWEYEIERAGKEEYYSDTWKEKHKGHKWVGEEEVDRKEAEYFVKK